MAGAPRLQSIKRRTSKSNKMRNHFIAKIKFANNKRLSRFYFVIIAVHGINKNSKEQEKKKGKKRKETPKMSDVEPFNCFMIIIIVVLVLIPVSASTLDACAERAEMFCSVRGLFTKVHSIQPPSCQWQCQPCVTIYLVHSRTSLTYMYAPSTLSAPTTAHSPTRS